MGRILVTGGSGSLGTVLIADLLKTTDDVVICYSRDVHRQHGLVDYLHSKGFDDRFLEDRLRLFIGDVRDQDRLFWAMRGVDTVVHTAALKHVGEGEYNSSEYIRTNIEGTSNVAEAAIQEGVSKCLFIGTDKIPGAVNLYGKTKAVAERLWIRLNQYGHPKTKLSALRYGNVFDSRGSVVEVWQSLIAQGLPISVCVPDPTRFVCFLPWGVEWIKGALAFMQGGEVFVPAGLQAISMHSLASYLQSDKSQWIESPLLSSEKQHEILIAPEEYSELSITLPLQYNIPYRMFVINPDTPRWRYSKWSTDRECGVSVDRPYSSGRVPLMPIEEFMRLYTQYKE